MARHRTPPHPQRRLHYVASYALHLAAAKILFLAEAHEAMDGI